MRGEGWGAASAVMGLLRVSTPSAAATGAFGLSWSSMAATRRVGGDDGGRRRKRAAHCHVPRPPPARPVRRPRPDFSAENCLFRYGTCRPATCLSCMFNCSTLRNKISHLRHPADCVALRLPCFIALRISCSEPKEWQTSSIGSHTPPVLGIDPPQTFLGAVHSTVAATVRTHPQSTRFASPPKPPP